MELIQKSKLNKKFKKVFFNIHNENFEFLLHKKIAKGN